MPNGVDLILVDHENVQDLFERFDATGDASIVGQVIDKLKAHDEAEMFALYPLAGVVLGDAKLVEHAMAAHTAVKHQIDVVSGLEGQPLVDAVALLRTLVREHVADEEKTLLPALAAEASPAQLGGLGARVLQIKQRGG